ncbi:MAG: nicotinamide-nucleotide adenylyltransferase [Nanoarchaeota archaeon]|nr:nicotinamide-nucleotide adenylyltransferase [Nanoarchaeota archaeon]MBU1004828.1 nicotinamide-nucleotide adenylyltransferase [Nanoarchaeota archaeon]MBU1946766.1 nicotinamide-nucleotide adenylyltransferase [Nanoarchaeota archaeon]
MIALFIGRFQPFHKAHLSDIKLALKECSKVIIAIGSSQESGTKDNPFTYEERKEMIYNTLKAHKVMDYDIVPVPDINDDKKWVSHVKKIIPDFDVAYTGNKLTQKLFKEKGIKINKIELIPHISATEIRKRILHGNEWAGIVPEDVAEYIRKINGEERIKRINGERLLD